MSEPLFVLLMLGAIVLALPATPIRRVRRRRSLAGLAILDARQRDDPARCRWRSSVWAQPRRSCVRPCRRVLVAVALADRRARGRSATRSSCTPSSRSRPSSARRSPGPTTTRRAPTARTRPRGGPSRGVQAYLPLVPSRGSTTPEIVIERRLRAAPLRLHPRAPDLRRARSLYWNTRRMLDLASWRWSRHTAVDDQRGAATGQTPGVVCFWIVARARAGRRTRRGARPVPWLVWTRAARDVPERRLHSPPRHRATARRSTRSSILLAALALAPRSASSHPDQAARAPAFALRPARDEAPSLPRT